MKPIYQSKTFGVAIFNIVALKVFPDSREWISNNPECYALIVTIAMIALRFITKRAVKWGIKKI
jgi:hypothetical protein